MSGETHFHAEATLQIPEACELGQLQRELEKIAGDLMVDFKLQPLPEPR